MDALPQGSENSQLNGKDHAEKTAEFKKMVDQSHQKMQAENQPPKRGRGRPPGMKNKVSGTSAPDTSSVNPPPSVAGPVPPPDVSQYLIGPLVMVSKIPAGRHGIPELALTPDEAGLCAVACNQLICAFIPDVAQMSPRTAAIISAGSVLGAVGFSKYQIYLAKKNEKTEPNEEPTITQVHAPKAMPTSFGTVAATDHFKRP